MPEDVRARVPAERGAAPALTSDLLIKAQSNITLVSTTPPADTDDDGMPDTWETSHGLDPRNAADGNGDGNRDGGTNLEEYLNGLVASP